MWPSTASLWAPVLTLLTATTLISIIIRLVAHPRKIWRKALLNVNLRQQRKALGGHDWLYLQNGFQLIKTVPIDLPRDRAAVRPLAAASCPPPNQKAEFEGEQMLLTPRAAVRCLVTCGAATRTE